jgi:hypothetical protein
VNGLKRFRSKNQDGGFLGGLGKRKATAKIMPMNGKVNQRKLLIKKISKKAPPAIVGKFKNGHMALSCIGKAGCSGWSCFLRLCCFF